MAIVRDAMAANAAGVRPAEIGTSGGRAGTGRLLRGGGTIAGVRAAMGRRRAAGAMIAAAADGLLSSDAITIASRRCRKFARQT